jgi:hypothetical protein
MQEVRATLSGIENEEGEKKNKKANRSVSKQRQPSWSEQRLGLCETKLLRHHKN